MGENQWQLDWTTSKSLPQRSSKPRERDAILRRLWLLLAKQILPPGTVNDPTWGLRSLSNNSIFLIKFTTRKTKWKERKLLPSKPLKPPKIRRKLSRRKGKLKSLKPNGTKRIKKIFDINPTNPLIGLMKRRKPNHTLMLKHPTT